MATKKRMYISFGISMEVCTRLPSLVARPILVREAISKKPSKYGHCPEGGEGGSTLAQMLLEHFFMDLYMGPFPQDGNWP